MNITATTLIPIAQIGFGFLLLFIIGKLYLSARDMHSWEMAQGTITKSAIKAAGSAFSPDIEFQYSILGVEYKGTSVTIPPKQTYQAKVAQGWVTEYPVGKKVNVYYNPEIHHMAVLEKGYLDRKLMGLSRFGAFPDIIWFCFPAAPHPVVFV